jgi:hypothetical protein
MTDADTTQAATDAAAQVIRSTISALEAEKLRLTTKLDSRIASLRQMLEELEPPVPEPIPKPKRSRTSSSRRSPKR